MMVSQLKDIIEIEECKTEVNIDILYKEVDSKEITMIEKDNNNIKVNIVNKREDLMTINRKISDIKEKTEEEMEDLEIIEEIKMEDMKETTGAIKEQTEEEVIEEEEKIKLLIEYLFKENKYDQIK